MTLYAWPNADKPIILVRFMDDGQVLVASTQAVPLLYRSISATAAFQQWKYPEE